jgi:type IV pilus assembly protein PilY1
MSNKRWAVIFGNGYNNTENDESQSNTGKAALYILFIEDGLDGNWQEGSDYIKIVTDTGSPDDPKGLAAPSAVDVDGDFDADFIYAGDLKGNLWRFDVTSDKIEDWIEKKPKSIFVATSPAGDNQSITIQPQGRRHPKCGGAMIYFGTGKYLETSDHDTNIPTQTFYGIWDAEAVTDKSRPGQVSCGNSFGKPLLKQTITDYGSELRLSSNEKIKWEEHSGWHVDFPTAGERVISQPLLRGLNILFTTNIPSPEACSFGGTSWLMVLDAESGGSPDNSFDLTNDSEINENDKLNRGNGNGEDDQKVAASGKKFEGGFSSSPAVLHANNYNYDHTYIGGADGTIRNQKSKNDDKTGRMAWRQDYAK